MSGNGTPEHAASTTSPFEWAVAGVGLAALLALIAYMLWFAVTQSAAIPVVEVGQVEIQKAGKYHLVRFEVRNAGGATAASLRLTGELRRGDQVVERADTEIDYLPRFSSRRAGLFFQVDPAAYDIRILPTGYTDP